MLLKVPTEIDNKRILGEGVLEPEIVTVSQQIKGFGPLSSLSDISNKLPTVSIGEPLINDIIDCYETVPKWLESKLDNGKVKFYFVCFCCSFRSPSDEFQLRQAKFIAELKPDGHKNQPIARDLYPLKIDKAINRNFQITLSPNLKFKQVQGSLGNVDFGLDYTELQPMIIATGAGEKQPCWEYKKVKGSYIEGSKFMYLLLQTPREMQSVITKMNIYAELEYKGNFITNLVLTKRNTHATDCWEVDLMRFL